MQFLSIPVCQACVFGPVVILVEILTTTTTKVTVGDQTRTVVDPVEAVAFRSGDQVVADLEDLEDPEAVVPVETQAREREKYLPVVWKR